MSAIYDRYMQSAQNWERAAFVAGAIGIVFALATIFSLTHQGHHLLTNSTMQMDDGILVVCALVGVATASIACEIAQKKREKASHYKS